MFIPWLTALFVLFVLATPFYLHFATPEIAWLRRMKPSSSAVGLNAQARYSGHCVSLLLVTVISFCLVYDYLGFSLMPRAFFVPPFDSIAEKIEYLKFMNHGANYQFLLFSVYYIIIYSIFLIINKYNHSFTSDVANLSKGRYLYYLFCLIAILVFLLLVSLSENATFIYTGSSIKSRSFALSYLLFISFQYIIFCLFWQVLLFTYSTWKKIFLI